MKRSASSSFASNKRGGCRQRVGNSAGPAAALLKRSVLQTLATQPRDQGGLGLCNHGGALFKKLYTKHMGTDSWLYASVLWLLVYKMLPGSPDENLVQLWEQMRAFYKARHITGTYSNMFLCLFTKRRSPNTSYPKMRGKACEIKLLGEALLQVWLHYDDAASDIHGQIRLLLQYSVGLDAILHDNREVSCLPPAIFRQFMDTCERFLVLYSAVNRHFVDSGYLLFNVTPKLHLLWHAAHACQHVVNKLVDKFARGFTFRMQRQAAF